MIRKKGQQGVQSVEVGMRLLLRLGAARRPMMLRDLAVSCGMAPAKAHRYMVSLTQAGLVEQSEESGLYDLGAEALNLGLAALGRLQPLAVARPFLTALQREIKQTVAVAVWANHGPTVVSWIGEDAPVAASMRVGSVMPLTRSATGLVFLAFMPEAQTHTLLRKELQENGRLGLKPSSRADCESEVAVTHRRGFAATSNFIPGISGCAVPVFEHTGAIALAIVALGYTGEIDLTVGGEVMARILQQARALSARLGALGELG